MGRKKKNKLIVYESKNVTLSKEEKEILEYKLHKEKEKFERDRKCGGIDELGNYTRLHSR